MTSYKTFLMIEQDGEYEKLVDIKSIPDLGGAPEMVERTTLSDGMKTYEVGIQDVSGLEFPANYNLVDFKRIKALEGSQHNFAVWFGGDIDTSTGALVPHGNFGKFEYTGALSVRVNGAGVNEIVEMVITIAPSTQIELGE